MLNGGRRRQQGLAQAPPRRPHTKFVTGRRNPAGAGLARPSATARSQVLMLCYPRRGAIRRQPHDNCLKLTRFGLPARLV